MKKEIVEKIQKNRNEVLAIAEKIAVNGEVNAFKVFSALKTKLEINDSYTIEYGKVRVTLIRMPNAPSLPIMI